MLAALSHEAMGGVVDVQTGMPTLACDSIETRQVHKPACPHCLVVALRYHRCMNNHAHATRWQCLDIEGMLKGIFLPPYGGPETHWAC